MGKIAILIIQHKTILNNFYHRSGNIVRLINDTTNVCNTHQSLFALCVLVTHNLHGQRLFAAVPTTTHAWLFYASVVWWVFANGQFWISVLVELVPTFSFAMCFMRTRILSTATLCAFYQHPHCGISPAAVPDTHNTRCSCLLPSGLCYLCVGGLQQGTA